MTSMLSGLALIYGIPVVLYAAACLARPIFLSVEQRRGM